jgi:hypothetical protein
MIMPPLQGNLSAKDFVIYAACDEKYFDDFAKILINSITANTSDNIHVHIFNPRIDQIEFCQNKNISYSYEYVSINLFQAAADKWKTIPTDPVKKKNYDRILNAMGKGGDRDIVERIQKTYYACARFIRLSEMISSQTVLSIDVDAVVRSDIPKLPTDKDLYIHFIDGKDPRYLAGGIFLNVSGIPFIKDYSIELKRIIEDDNIHWGIDQDILNCVVPKYNTGALPLSYIDWYMSPGSYVWTAKGTRKNLSLFINEQKKYNV